MFKKPDRKILYHLDPSAKKIYVETGPLRGVVFKRLGAKRDPNDPNKWIVTIGTRDVVFTVMTPEEVGSRLTVEAGSRSGIVGHKCQSQGVEDCVNWGADSFQPIAESKLCVAARSESCDATWAKVKVNLFTGNDCTGTPKSKEIVLATCVE
ncbi:MAG: hypothetical protein ACYTGZ_10030 [Planctomycetota bacterium]